MPSLSDKFVTNTYEHWLIAAGIAAVVYLMLKIILVTVRRRLPALADRTATQIDDAVVEVLGRTRFFFLAAVAIVIGSAYLTLPSATTTLIHVVFMLVVLVQAGLWLNGGLSFWLQGTIKRRMAEDVASTTAIAAMGFLARILVWLIVLLLALDNLGVNITALITGIGIGGIAIALALQKILEDIFSSMSIILDKPFVIGDFIVVGDATGTVEHIGIKTTRIRSLSGEQLVLANSDLLTSRIRNFKRMNERRVEFRIGIIFGTPHDKLSSVAGMLRAIVESQPSVRFDRAHFKGFGESSLDFEVVYYVLTPDFNRFMDIQQGMNLAIVQKFASEGISFAYPTRTVVVRPDGVGDNDPADFPRLASVGSPANSPS
jgi:small-conductance mechanosensitive channel